MNTTTLLWLSALSGGFASAIAAYATLIAIVGRMDWTHARGALWTERIVEQARSQSTAWLCYSAPVIGFALAAKAIWDGGWILALCCISAGMICFEPLQVFLRARTRTSDVEVADLALICMAHTQYEKTILQTLERASVTLNHSGVHKSIASALARFYNGATESETLEYLLAEHSNSDWALLVWTLFERRRGGSDTDSAKTLDAMMMRRLRMRKRTRPAYEMMRRSVALALILGVALACYLILTPASAYYTASLQGQSIGVLLLCVWLWITRVWTTQLQTIEAMIE